MTLLAFFWFAAGLVAGSFANVLIFRHNTGRAPTGRSACLSCGRTLGVLELVPVVSFLALRGRCRACGSAISLQYPLVELASGALFLGVFSLSLPLLPTLTALLAGLLLIMISAYDVRHTVIPDGYVYALALLGLLTLVVGPGGTLALPGLWEALAGPLFALPFLALSLVSGGRWMGLGDAKLALAIGWLLGPSPSVAAFLLSFWIGSAAVLALAAASYAGRIAAPSGELSRYGKALTMKSEVPFAPFLVTGAAAAFFFGIGWDDIALTLASFPW